MDININQIRNKMISVERHSIAYRYQLSSSEWCEIYLIIERDYNEEWKLIELFVSSHNYESNQMTLEGLENRLSSIIVSKKSSSKAWDEAKRRASKIFRHLQMVISNYGINYVFKVKHL